MSLIPHAAWTSHMDSPEVPVTPGIRLYVVLYRWLAVPGYVKSSSEGVLEYLQ